MILTRKTEAALKKIDKALNEKNLTFEVVGNQILTENCNIDVNVGKISVNEKEVLNIEDMLNVVLKVERPDLFL